MTKSSTNEAPVVVLPPWLQDLHRSEIGVHVSNDPRSCNGLIMGFSPGEICTQVIGGGRADFDAPHKHLSGADRALLYAYFNQRGHLEELYEAFSQLFGDAIPQDPLIVLDIGCGPFTAGLALAAAVPDLPFTYIGCDRATSMRDLGEHLALAAEQAAHLSCLERQWVRDLTSVKWDGPPRWRPVLIIASYLLASATLDIETLVADVNGHCSRFGRGPATILYTNSHRPEANSKYPLFRAALEEAGFQLRAEDKGLIRIDRFNGWRDRELRYALFHRKPQRKIKLKEA